MNVSHALAMVARNANDYDTNRALGDALLDVLAAYRVEVIEHLVAQPEICDHGVNESSCGACAWLGSAERSVDEAERAREYES